jgi:hypothetical protein
MAGIGRSIRCFPAKSCTTTQTQLVDLGVATGYAINNAGQVALSTGIYSNGAVTALPALPGFNYSGHRSSHQRIRAGCRLCTQS